MDLFDQPPYSPEKPPIKVVVPTAPKSGFSANEVPAKYRTKLKIQQIRQFVKETKAKVFYTHDDKPTDHFTMTDAKKMLGSKIPHFAHQTDALLLYTVENSLTYCRLYKMPQPYETDAENETLLRLLQGTPAQKELARQLLQAMLLPKNEQPL